MGFKKWAASAALANLVLGKNYFALRKDTVVRKQVNGFEKTQTDEQPLDGVAASIDEDGLLVVQGPEFNWIVPLDGKNDRKVEQFVTMVNSQAANIAGPLAEAPEPSAPTVSALPIAAHPAEKGSYKLDEDRIAWERSEMLVPVAEDFPLDGVTARIESGQNVHKRLTVTRRVLLGPLSLALPKTKGGESYLTIEGPDFF